MRSWLLIILTALATSAEARSSLNDFDGDNLPDRIEDGNGNGIVDPGETDPFNADSDDGGEADGSELRGERDPLSGADDLTFDRDDDGLINGIEIERKSDPDLADTDEDGIGDANDAFPNDERYSKDADSDEIPDEYEVDHGMDTSVDDSDTDADGDALTNAEEFEMQTNPQSADTDADGINDQEELEQETDPTTPPCLSPSNPPPKPFPDVKGHWSTKVVELLHGTIQTDGKPLVEGYLYKGKRHFFPNREASRFELLKIALVSTCAPWIDDNERPVKVFRDVPYLTSGGSEEQRFRQKVIYTGLKRGIVQGYPEGDFRPDIIVNRAEALAMLLRATGKAQLATPTPENLTFSDVPKHAWYRDLLSIAVGSRIIEGYKDRTFRAGNPITRAEVAKIAALLMMQNPSVNAKLKQ